jgi:hypothetical protein
VLSIEQYTHIIPAEDEHDDMELVPASLARIELITTPLHYR